MKVYSHANDECLQPEKKINPPFPPKTKKGKQKRMTNGNNKTSRKYIRRSTMTINGLFGISLRRKNER